MRHGETWWYKGYEIALPCFVFPYQYSSSGDVQLLMFRSGGPISIAGWCTVWLYEDALFLATIPGTILSQDFVNASF
jgi:hypothetical protein